MFIRKACKTPHRQSKNLQDDFFLSTVRIYWLIFSFLNQCCSPCEEKRRLIFTIFSILFSHWQRFHTKVVKMILKWILRKKYNREKTKNNKSKKTQLTKTNKKVSVKKQAQKRVNIRLIRCIAKNYLNCYKLFLQIKNLSCETSLISYRLSLKTTKQIYQELQDHLFQVFYQSSIFWVNTNNTVLCCSKSSKGKLWIWCLVLLKLSIVTGGLLRYALTSGWISWLVFC